MKKALLVLAFLAIGGMVFAADWNPADLNDDGIVNVMDMFVISKAFGAKKELNHLIGTYDVTEKPVPPGDYAYIVIIDEYDEVVEVIPGEVTVIHYWVYEVTWQIPDGYPGAGNTFTRTVEVLDPSYAPKVGGWIISVEFVEEYDKVIEGKETEVTVHHWVYEEYWTQDPRWDPMCDLNNDGVINVIDVFIVAKNFGEEKE